MVEARSGSGAVCVGSVCGAEAVRAPGGSVLLDGEGGAGAFLDLRRSGAAIVVEF